MIATASVIAACGAKKMSKTDEPGATAAASNMAAAGDSLQTQAGLWRLSTMPAFVGAVVRNSPQSMTHPSDYCLDDGNHYTGAAVRLGDLNVFIDPDLMDDQAGGVAVVYGERGASLFEALTRTGPCPPDYGRQSPEAQMRSDWMSAEGGAKTTVERVTALPYIRASSMHAVSLHRVVSDGADGGPVVIELVNPFDVGLDAVAAQAHYEGGPGKPMPKMLPVSLVLPPGGTQRLELAGSIDGGPAGADSGEPRGTYWLYGLDLRGTVGMAELDVSVLLFDGRRGPRRR